MIAPVGWITTNNNNLRVGGSDYSQKPCMGKFSKGTYHIGADDGGVDQVFTIFSCLCRHRMELKPKSLTI